MKVSPDGKLLILIKNGLTIQVYELGKSFRLLKLQKVYLDGKIEWINFSFDMKKVYFGYNHGRVEERCTFSLKLLSGK